MSEALNRVQIEELKRAKGSVEGYLKSLNDQAQVAKAFYFGHVDEGMAGYLLLPDDVRLQIDQLIWDASGGQNRVRPRLVAEAIMYSIEMRMGISD